MLLIRNEAGHHSEKSPEQMQQFLESVMAYIGDLKNKGRLIGAQPLGSEGTMLSGSPGMWKDGPYNESKEIIIGYYHILAADMDEAIAIAKGNPEFAPGAGTRIEIRQIITEERSLDYVYPKGG